ncbi:MAG TPA: DUF4397 domain-containing protein [Pelobium sp.]
MFKIKESLILFFACSILVIVYTGCEPVGEQLQLGEARLRIVNAVPENNEFSFFINDSLKTGQALRFGEASAYYKVAAGTSKVYTKLHDAVLPNTNINLFLNPSTDYTLFLSGLAAKDSLIYVSTLDRMQILSDTMATVRFINVSPDAGNLNLVFQKNLVDSVNVISNINYRTSSAYVKIKPQNYFLRVKSVGESVKLANLDNYQLQAGKIYTFWTKGLVKGAGEYALELKVFNDK